MENRCLARAFSLGEGTSALGYKLARPDERQFAPGTKRPERRYEDGVRLVNSDEALRTIQVRASGTSDRPVMRGVRANICVRNRIEWLLVL